MWLLKTKSNKELFFENIKTLQLVLSTIRKLGDDGFIYKAKKNNLINTIMIASIIGSLMEMYDPKIRRERSSAIDIIRARLKKFMFIKSRSNKREFLIAISNADRAWHKTIKYFANIKPQIEIVATVIRLYSVYSDLLGRYANINDKQIEAFAKGDGTRDNIGDRTQQLYSC